MPTTRTATQPERTRTAAPPATAPETIPDSRPTHAELAVDSRAPKPGEDPRSVELTPKCPAPPR